MDEFYKLSREECLKCLNSSENGIDEEEANKRLRKYGLNKLKEKRKKSVFVKFL